jgi:hypothetical protein
MNLNPHPNEIEEPFPAEEAAPSNVIENDQVTGLPGLPTWGRVYSFVVIVFVVYVVLLSMLSRVFS